MTENPESLALAVERVERFLAQRTLDIKRGRRGSGDRIYFPWLIDIHASDLRALVDASKLENTDTPNRNPRCPEWLIW